MKLWVVCLCVVAVCLGQVVVATFDAPDTNISGLAYGENSLWAVDGSTDGLYKLNPSTGAIQDSWYLSLSGAHPTGLGFVSNQVYVGTTSGYVYYYTTDGAYLGSFSALC